MSVAIASVKLDISPTVNMINRYVHNQAGVVQWSVSTSFARDGRERTLCVLPEVCLANGGRQHLESGRRRLAFGLASEDSSL
jgi:hypothetical protein